MPVRDSRKYWRNLDGGELADGKCGNFPREVRINTAGLKGLPYFLADRSSWNFSTR